jgi:hypothetical protein
VRQFPKFGIERLPQFFFIVAPGPAQVERKINKGIEPVNVGFGPDRIGLIGHLLLLLHSHEILKRGGYLMAPPV